VTAHGADAAIRAHGPGPAIALTVWGAGGSSPVGHSGRILFGGDTVCFEFQARGAAAPLILDLGSGARRLGRALMLRDTGPRCDVLLSHLHLDHIMGLPFFAPLFQPGIAVHLHCGVLPDAPAVARALRALVAPPFFPVEALEREAVTVHHFAPAAPFDLAGFRVTPVALNHPGGCCGFRLEAGGASVMVIGDHEHGNAAIDAAVAQAASGADLLIYDGSYDAESYAVHQGWGHSTWECGVALARSAGARALLVHHHMPERSDSDLARAEARMRAVMPSAGFARQDMRVDIDPKATSR